MGGTNMAASQGQSQRFEGEEVVVRSANGMTMLIIISLLMLASIAGFVWGVIQLEAAHPTLLEIVVFAVSLLYLFIIGPVMYIGLKILKPNDALVLTLFGTYIGTLRGPGFFYVNPFCSAASPASVDPSSASQAKEKPVTISSFKFSAGQASLQQTNKKISLKAMTLNNDKQKINDALGNPIIIGIVVVWRVVNAAKAVFNVDNYTEFLSIQCDSALRNIVRLYPYDASDEEGEKSLRGSSQEVADKLKDEIQAKVLTAGLEIIEARITHLSYAPEIAAAMLQRQQASAIIAARQMIVEGAVGMVEMALAKLSEQQIVELDEERKAAMVSNLLVVLCANKDAQPVVNSGSLY